MSSHQLRPAGPVEIRDTENFLLASDRFDREFRIFVGLPFGGLRGGSKLPVVYVADGGYMFGLALYLTRFLSLGPRAIPPALVVGIGYRIEPPESELTVTAALRTRDLTPSNDARYLKLARSAPPPYTLPDNIRGGGAANFLGFITEELMPLIAARYPTAEDDCTLLGHSFGGLFAMSTLLSASGAFKRYVASSPYPTWDDHHLVKAAAALGAGALSGHAFLSAGALEDGQEPGTLAALQKLVAALAPQSGAGFELKSQVFPDETHQSVLPLAFALGLRSVFGKLD